MLNPPRPSSVLSECNDAADGNGRLTRTITDLALAQGEAQAIRFYAMSASILEDRSGYYRVLEWFLQTLLRSLQHAMTRIDSVLGRRDSGRHTRDPSYRPSKQRY